MGAILLRARGPLLGPVLGNNGQEATNQRQLARRVDEISHHQAKASFRWQEGRGMIVRGASVLNGGPLSSVSRNMYRQRTENSAATSHPPPF